MPTICHNLDYQEASHKLYLYKNEDTVPLFHCYTECSETFNIYQLVQKYYRIRNQHLTYREAMKKIHGDNFEASFQKSPEPEIQYETIFKNPLSIKLPEYSKYPLEMFYLDDIHPWRQEGMELEMLRKFEIGYSKSLQQISIPHRDWRGRLIGIRVRNLHEEKIQQYKYMPLYANQVFYSHPLSLNLYGIYHNQQEIKKAQKVYLYEAEKSVFFHHLLANNHLALSTCGKNISKWHSDMLIHFLKVKQVIIGFDKEYDNYSTTFDYVNKIKQQTTYLRNFVEVGILIDEEGILAQKQAPVDGTKSQFNRMKIWWLD